MAASTTVNGRTVVHRTSGGTLATFPDVCLTPSPGGPLPVPYPNLARSADLTNGSETVTVDGSPIAIEGSVFARSTGDEPGTQKGVLSQAQGGEARFLNWSFDVKVEGKGVCRLMDPMASNGGSPTNTPPAAEVQPPLVVPPGLGPDDGERSVIDVQFRYAYPRVLAEDAGVQPTEFETPLRFTGPENETWSPPFGYTGVLANVWTGGDFTMEFDAFDLTPYPYLPGTVVEEYTRRAKDEVLGWLDRAKRLVGNAIEDLDEVRARLQADVVNAALDLSAGAQARLARAMDELSRARSRAGDAARQLGEAASQVESGDWTEAGRAAQGAAREASDASRDAARAARDLGRGLEVETRRARRAIESGLDDAVEGLEDAARDVDSALRTR